MVKKEIVKKTLKDISDREGILLPQSVVDEATPEESPIHELFDWNNDTAGDKYRLWQARQLIASVKITFEDREIHEYYNIQVETIPQKGYYSKEQIISDEEKYQAVLKTALAELSYFEQKYRDIKELKRVFAAIQSVI